MEKLSSTKSVPDAKKVEDLWPRAWTVTSAASELGY